MSRRVLPFVVSVLLTGLVAVGCGTDEDPDAPAVAWAEQVCASVERGAATLASPPATDPNDPQGAKVVLADYLGRVSQALDTVAGGIREAGAPPVDDGQRAVDDALRTITELRAALDSAKNRVARLETTDPAGFQQALTEVGNGLAEVGGVEGPTKDLKANPALNTAFGKAPTCQKVDGSAE
ncbi:MAG TPA: hypothetical protein VFV67_07645 [Actinophytocola sp.]|uniref:hypothetical protein n=1 Tax=Actinophytocola sp. TaxID=1872138 RepID=UPI002DB80D1D|nr:hypothetical protein [Actinophytocola sp.]HEU5470511.1 hypothetical protein [Actinophytocola sp.]